MATAVVHPCSLDALAGALAALNIAPDTAVMSDAISTRLCSRPESASIRPPCGRAPDAPWAGSA